MIAAISSGRAVPDATSQAIRATSVVVLPLPAGATHSTGPGGAVAAARWSGASRASRSATDGCKSISAVSRRRTYPATYRPIAVSPYDRVVTPELESALAKLPDRPGVYLMKDARGDVVYVGKAQSLAHRVRSYWQKGNTGPLEGHRIRARHRPDRRRRGDPDRLGLRGAPPRDAT